MPSSNFTALTPIGERSAAVPALWNSAYSTIDANFAVLLPAVGVNVKAPAYGALGNGVANDLPAFRSAVTSSSTGEAIAVPLGTYKVLSVVTLDKGVILRGAGAIGEGGGVAAVSGSIIQGTGLTLVRMTDAGVLADLIISDPTGDANTVALEIVDAVNGVVNWELRGVYLNGTSNKLGTGLRPIFGLKGLILGGNIDGWDTGVDLQSTGGSKSNANTFVATKLRLNTTALKTTDVDDVGLFGSTIEGNATGVKHESGLLLSVGNHYENNVGVQRNIHTTGTGTIASFGDAFYTGSTDLSVYIESGAGRHTFYSMTPASGIKHNGTGVVTVVCPVNAVSVSGTGPVAQINGTGITALQNLTSQTFSISGYAYIATALSILNASGAAAIGGTGGVNFKNGTNTTVAWVSATGAFYPQNSGGGPGIFSGAGSPEGNQTGPVGCGYLRTNGAGNTTLYVKESGTGNTGWVAK